MKKLYSMTPREIVDVLDKYIIGQDEAKKSVAIALRNRYRRSLLSEEIQEEITPKNILMIGPTGVGKTEIARRIAKLMDAPFAKVEATKFTEVGYVGRDVDSMVRDLVEASIRLTKQGFLDDKRHIAEKLAEDRIVEALMPSREKEENKGSASNPFEFIFSGNGYVSQKEEYENKLKEIQEKDRDETDINLAQDQVREQLRAGKLEDEIVTVEVEAAQRNNALGMENEGVSIAIGSIFGDALPKNKKKKTTTVKEARKILIEEEAQNLIDMDQVIDEAIENAEQNGMIFIDEIDKIAISSNHYGSGGVSREGVQRDILPIVEGSVVNTKYGPVKTDHILFIGAGAFHLSKPSDLIPELQGRFPIRVELENLTEEDFVKILTVPENAIIKQQIYLLETEGIKLQFTDDAIGEIGKLAYKMNADRENIGARRLHTILEKLMEDIAFNLPDGIDVKEEYVIDAQYVLDKFKEKIGPEDLQQYII